MVRVERIVAQGRHHRRGRQRPELFSNDRAPNAAGRDQAPQVVSWRLSASDVKLATEWCSVSNTADLQLNLVQDAVFLQEQPIVTTTRPQSSNKLRFHSLLADIGAHGQMGELPAASYI